MLAGVKVRHGSPPSYMVFPGVPIYIVCLVHKPGFVSVISFSDDIEQLPDSSGEYTGASLSQPDMPKDFTHGQGLDYRLVIG